MAFTSDESGREEVYIQDFPDAKMRRKVSSGGGGLSKVGRKGDELFYRSLEGRLVAVPVRFNGTSVDVGDPRVVMRLIQPPAVHGLSVRYRPGRTHSRPGPGSGAPAGVSLRYSWTGRPRCDDNVLMIPGIRSLMVWIERSGRSGWSRSTKPSMWRLGPD